MCVCYDELLDSIAFSGFLPTHTLATTPLEAVCLDRQAFQVATVTQSDSRVGMWDEILICGVRELIERQFGFAILAISLPKLAGFLFYDCQHSDRVIEQGLQFSDAALQLLKLVCDALPLQRGETPKLHVQDGLCLRLGETERRH